MFHEYHALLDCSHENITLEWIPMPKFVLWAFDFQYEWKWNLFMIHWENNWGEIICDKTKVKYVSKWCGNNYHRFAIQVFLFFHFIFLCFTCLFIALGIFLQFFVHMNFVLLWQKIIQYLLVIFPSFCSHKCGFTVTKFVQSLLVELNKFPSHEMFDAFGIIYA